MPGIAEAKGRARRRAQVKRTLIGYTFLTPASAITILFIFVPVFMAFYLSFFEWDLISPPKTFVGLRNYARLFGSKDFFCCDAQYPLFRRSPAAFGLCYLVGYRPTAEPKKIRGLSFYRTVFSPPP